MYPILRILIALKSGENRWCYMYLFFDYLLIFLWMRMQNLHFRRLIAGMGHQLYATKNNFLKFTTIYVGLRGTDPGSAARNSKILMMHRSR